MTESPKGQTKTAFYRNINENVVELHMEFPHERRLNILRVR
jgi:hypothetical protein